MFMNNLSLEKNIFAPEFGNESADDAAEETLARKMYLQSLEKIMAMLDRIQGDLDPEECGLDLECRKAQLAVELHKSEHDNAGAYKFKRLERRTAEIFDAGEPDDRISVQGEGPERRLEIGKNLRERRYLFVAINELDRLNKEGKSQFAGDVGLEATIAATLAAAKKILGDDAMAEVGIYRYGSNEYCLEMPKATEVQLALLAESVRNAKLDLGKYSEVEAPPLTVSEASLEDLVAVMENARTVSPLLEDDHETLSREYLGLLRRAADFELETEKYFTRFGRGLDKMARVAAGEITEGEAEAFFDTYLKKGFFGLVDSWSGFKKLAASPEHERQLSQAAHKVALARLEADAEFDKYQTHLATGRFQELTLLAKEQAESVTSSSPETLDQVVAVIPRTTDGQAFMAGKKRAYLLAKEAWQKTGDTSPTSVAKLEMDVREYEYLVEYARRDAKTGLLERGQFYGDWNRQVAEANDGKGEAAVIFADMGFLKYFNDAGGRKVGDAALHKATEIMEQAVANSGIRAEVYRYGGDEFAVRVEGNRKDAEKIKLEINRLCIEAGRIPDLAGLRKQGIAGVGNGNSREDYGPTNLVFNFGISEAGDTAKIMADLAESGELDKLLASRSLTADEFSAELLVRLADNGVHFEKAVSRIDYLIGLMEKPEYADHASRYRKQVDAITKYSRKAIFGETVVLDFFAQGRKFEDLKVFADQVERFVLDRMEKAGDILASEKSLADKMISLASVIGRLDRRIAELSAKQNRDDGIIEELRAKMADSVASLAGLKEVRKNIAEAK